MQNTNITNKENYSPEVQKLFSLYLWPDDWKEYLDLGVGAAQTEELLKIVTHSKAFFEAESTEEDNINYYDVPSHAWRILAVIGETRVLKVFFEAFKQTNDDSVLDDTTDLIQYLGSNILPELDQLLEENISQIPDLKKYSEEASILNVFIEGIEKLALKQEEAKEKCLEILVKYLKNYKQQHYTINAFLISALVELKAKEHIELIREAFSEKNEDGSPFYVDEEINGGLHEVEFLLGLRKKDAEYKRLEEERKKRFKERHKELLESMNKFLESKEYDDDNSFVGFSSEGSSKGNKDKKKKKKLQKAARKKNRKK